MVGWHSSSNCGALPVGPVRLTILGDSAELEKAADAEPRNRINALLQHLDFPHLRHTYRISSFDAGTGVVEITYDGGKMKNISDYGGIGTYGLSALETLLFELSTSGKWIRTNAPTPSLLIAIDLSDQ